ncbi:hypothetical cytosolic protein [Candidatus Moduliflexus flocculans]|uniref:Hypothetical cytosolic protein n=1 Tax=Candidatus Moduliflexus flocculans TaxID=1499966 RepID=A0A0S6VYG4_9BACT|nr:hypothetical cytosolic protein [Candidatus Moduliflexus flocculans]
MNPYQQRNSQYKDFAASELFCPKCRQAMPVRERLLLVLPDGDLYDYRCVRCGTSLGEKRVKNQQPIQIVY